MVRRINTHKNIVLQFTGILVVSSILILGCSNSDWKYQFRDVANVATLEFSNPRINIVFEGLSLGNFSCTGILPVYGLTVFRQTGGTHGGISFNSSYSNGVATVEIGSHTISIRDRGTIVIIDRQSFDVPPEGTLTLVVDQAGKVIQK
jgi:hypothetical protein